MSSDLLVELLHELDSHIGHYAELDRYYSGTQALAFLSPESYAALNKRFGRIASNIPRLAVTSLSERLRITGFKGVDVWQEFLANDLDQLSGVAHREALALGQVFICVWSRDGKPFVTVESATQVAVLRDPATREVTAAVKRWRTKTETFAVVYLPDRIERHRANSPGAATAGFELIETIDNPLGVVPVVPLVNSDRLLDEDGSSEIDDLIPLVDGLAKTLADLAVAQEYTSRPRRWATGIELVERPKVDADGVPVLDDDEQPIMEAVNPIEENARMAVAESPTAKFGAWDGAKLDGFESAVRIWLGQIMAVSALPAHYVGILTDQPASADAIRSAESSLTARASARQQTFGKAWEQVARLIVAVRDGVNPADVTVRVEWADAATRSVAQESDAAVKLYSAGILSRSAVLKRLNYSESEIAEELANTVRDAQIGADVKLGRFMADLS